MKNIVIVIPARYASTRLPGKPLALIAGKTMLQHVYELAEKAVKLSKKQTDSHIEILIATEDKRIVFHAENMGANAVLTSDKCRTGTDRALEAVDSLNYTPDFVINLQGDAPLTPPDFISNMIDEFLSYDTLQIITPVTQLNWAELDKLRTHKRTTPFSGTTVILNKENDALWFSKNIIPAIRDEEKLKKSDSLSPVYRHIGLYGYAYPVLKDFVSLEQSNYEVLEGLEQLRMIENGYKMRTVIVDYKNRPSMSGVDSPEDITRAEELLSLYKNEQEKRTAA